MLKSRKTDNYLTSSPEGERAWLQACLVTEISGYVITAKKDQDGSSVKLERHDIQPLISIEY